MKKDFRLEDLQTKYLEADLSFRTGKITCFEFNSIVLDVILSLMDIYGYDQPYLKNFEKAAAAYWEKAVLPDKFFSSIKDQTKSENQVVELLKKIYLIEDLKMRLGEITPQKMNQVKVNTLLSLLSQAGRIQPYYNEFLAESEKHWNANRTEYLLTNL